MSSSARLYWTTHTWTIQVTENLSKIHSSTQKSTCHLMNQKYIPLSSVLAYNTLGFKSQGVIRLSWFCPEWPQEETHNRKPFWTHVELKRAAHCHTRTTFWCGWRAWSVENSLLLCLKFCLQICCLHGKQNEPLSSFRIPSERLWRSFIVVVNFLL